MAIKQGRMSERIQTILSELLRREVSDPRLHNVTITEVQLDPEMFSARIYVNALGDETRQTEVLAGLKRASGFLRREVGKRVRLRSTPELHFMWDTTLEYGERINRLIDELDIPPDDTNDNTPNDDADDE
jgi:ribosome-binding factor A